MEVLVERTQNIIEDVQDQIKAAEAEKRRKLEEEKKRYKRKDRLEGTPKPEAQNEAQAILKSMQTTPVAVKAQSIMY